MAFGLPANAQALYARGLQHQQAGRSAEAERLYLQALAAEPRHADALYGLGLIASQAARHDVALDHFDGAVVARPEFADAHAARGAALAVLGRPMGAIAAFRLALAIERDHLEAQLGLADVLSDQGRLEEALPLYRSVIALDPALPNAQANFADALERLGRLDEAVAAYRKALVLTPEDGETHHRLGLALQRQGQLGAAEASLKKALELRPGDAAVSSNMLLALNYRADVTSETLLDAHRDWDRRYGGRPRPSLSSYPNMRDPDRRLRIGYVSGEFHRGPVSYFMSSVLSAHDRVVSEVFCYSNSAFADGTSEGLRASVQHWRSLAGVADDAAAALIRQDKIDILVDLSGHTQRNRLPLFAQRPAPIQASWLAYPCTTGLSGIDYLIMDSDMAPGAAERWCSEAVVRLPYGRLCYAPPDYAPDVVQLDRRPDQPITFASFNAIAKIGSEVVRLWTKVLAAAPGSRLLLKGEALTEPSVRWRLTQAFVAAGLDRKRLELRAASPHAQVLADHSEVDVALDPFPFGGGLTSLEALWMGVPVVTLPGERPASRQTLSFLRVLGLGDLVAMSQADYVRIAAGLAADPRRRALLRGALRARMAASPLCNGALFTPTLESAYRQMWRRWCAGQSATALNIRA